MRIKYRSQLGELLESLGMMGPVAEIGVAEGRFSLELLHMGIPKLYMVDAWRTLDQKGDGNNEQAWHDKNRENAIGLVAPYDDLGRVTVLRGLSSEVCYEVPNGSLSMVYLDADHSYDGVLRDLVAWYPKLKPGGVMAGHDFLNEAYGVCEAVQDFCADTIFSGKASQPDINKYLNLIPENKAEDAGFWFQKQ